MGRQFTTQEEKPEFVMIPEDVVFRARLEKIEVRGPYKRKDGTPFEKLWWWFEITSDGDFKGRKIRGETGADFAIGTRFHGWAETLLNRQIAMGTNVDLDDLEGLPADISVRWEDDWKDAAKKWAVVDQVMPIVAGGFSLGGEPPF